MTSKQTKMIIDRYKKEYVEPYDFAKELGVSMTTFLGCISSIPFQVKTTFVTPWKLTYSSFDYYDNEPISKALSYEVVNSIAEYFSYRGENKILDLFRQMVLLEYPISDISNFAVEWFSVFYSFHRYKKVSTMEFNADKVQEYVALKILNNK